MSYRVVIERRAQRELDGLPTTIRQRLDAAIARLANDPRPAGCLKLHGEDAWRIRVGAYRVVYEIQDDQLIVTVIRLGHRRDVYR